MYRIKVWRRTDKELVFDQEVTSSELANTMGFLDGMYGRDHYAIKLYEVNLKEVFWRFEDELTNIKRDQL